MPTRSLREVKGFVWGCLRGWLHEGYSVSKFEEVSFEATFAWPFVASFPCILSFCGFISFHFRLFVAAFPFILAVCGFISFHFGVLGLPQKCLVCVAKGSMAASFIPPKTWGAYGWGYPVLTRGLCGGYAALTRGELVASDKRNSQLEGYQIPQKSQSLIFENIMRKFAYASLLTRCFIIQGYAKWCKVLTTLTLPWEFSGIALPRFFIVPFSS